MSRRGWTRSPGHEARLRTRHGPALPLCATGVTHSLVPIAFSRSLRALGAERARGTALGVALAVVFLAAWSAWLVLGRVALIATSERARIEVAQAAVPLAPLIEGRVHRASLTLGQRVATGEVLLELDSRGLQLARAEVDAQRQGLLAELGALAGQHAALAAAIAAFEAGGKTRQSEASASAQEAQIAAAFARSMAERSASLVDLGVESSEAAEILQAKERGSEAVATIRRLQIARTRAELGERLATMRVDLARTAREEAELQRELAARIASLATLDHQIEQHSLRAPIAGRLGGVVPLQPGAVLARGAVVGRVIPDEPLRIVGRFTPAGVGRIRPGQPARMRLDGFPWTEYGSLHGRVAAVASEAEDGLVRVECDMFEQTGSRIPVEHGLTGVLEVETEAVSPATLLLRTIGQAIAP